MGVIKHVVSFLLVQNVKYNIKKSMKSNSSYKNLHARRQSTCTSNMLLLLLVLPVGGHVAAALQLDDQ